MRLLRLLLLLVFLGLGATLGGLNAAPVRVDFAFVVLHLHLGEALLASLLIGVVLGGAATWSSQRPRTTKLPKVATPATTATAVPDEEE